MDRRTAQLRALDAAGPVGSAGTGRGLLAMGRERVEPRRCGGASVPSSAVAS